MQNECLSLGVVAQILGVHPSTVRDWPDKGLLPVHRTPGGHRRYRRIEIELWVQSQLPTGENQKPYCPECYAVDPVSDHPGMLGAGAMVSKT